MSSAVAWRSSISRALPDIMFLSNGSIRQRPEDPDEQLQLRPM
jgi:hypothetical protein